MISRQIRLLKTGCYCNPVIERIRKARALGCSLSYLGINSQMSKRFASRISILAK
ncbi:MAG: hypothetical protein Q7S07_03355 [Candidatus Omnitrophota bacterium]|nr:hypothetical protein [Candidatus Omnitrophota bacterium]